MSSSSSYSTAPVTIDAFSSVSIQKPSLEFLNKKKSIENVNKDDMYIPSTYSRSTQLAKHLASVDDSQPTKRLSIMRTQEVSSSDIPMMVNVSDTYLSRSKQTIETPVYSGMHEWGNTLDFQLDWRDGDFISDQVVVIDVDDLPSYNTHDGIGIESCWRYTEYPGIRAIESVSMDVINDNGTTSNIASYTSLQAMLYARSHFSDEKLKNLYGSVGQSEPTDVKGIYNGMTYFATARKDGLQDPTRTKRPVRLFVPLMFWYNLCPKDALPRTSSRIRISVKLANASSVIQQCTVISSENNSDVDYDSIEEKNSSFAPPRIRVSLYSTVVSITDTALRREFFRNASELSRWNISSIQKEVYVSDTTMSLDTMPLTITPNSTGYYKRILVAFQHENFRDSFMEWHRFTIDACHGEVSGQVVDMVVPFAFDPSMQRHKTAIVGTHEIGPMTHVALTEGSHVLMSQESINPYYSAFVGNRSCFEKYGIYDLCPDLFVSNRSLGNLIYLRAYNDPRVMWNWSEYAAKPESNRSIRDINGTGGNKLTYYMHVLGVAHTPINASGVFMRDNATGRVTPEVTLNFTIPKKC